MQKITYKTGRTYDAEQVLEIEIEQDVKDEFETRAVVATFVDSSRRISGRVSAIVFGSDSVGAAVLAEYDFGRYTAI